MEDSETSRHEYMNIVIGDLCHVKSDPYHYDSVLGKIVMVELIRIIRYL